MTLIPFFPVPPVDPGLLIQLQHIEANRREADVALYQVDAYKHPPSETGLTRQLNRGHLILDNCDKIYATVIQIKTETGTAFKRKQLTPFSRHSTCGCNIRM